MSVTDRIVITGIGLTAPNGSNLTEFRQSLLAGRSGVVNYETRFMGPVLAGVCERGLVGHAVGLSRCPPTRTDTRALQRASNSRPRNRPKPCGSQRAEGAPKATNRDPGKP